jgi:hypothetical protein
VPALDDEARDEQRIQELQKALERAHRATAAAKHRTDDIVEAVYTAARDAALTVGMHPPVAGPRRDRRRGAESCILHLGDWQLGKVTHSFDPDVCEERVRLAVQKAVRLTEIQRADHPVKECHLLLGGDLVEGITVFPGQAWEVGDSTLFDQVFRASALIEQVVVSLLSAFERVVVWEVSGNHGRIGRKGDAPRRDNWDRIVGRIARDRLEAQGRLEWQTNDQSWYALVEVGAYRALLVHGDQIKSFGGNTPAFGILRKATAWASGAVRAAFQDVYMGHFHTPMSLTMPNGGTIRCVGSPESDNEYAAEFVAARGNPNQRLVFVDPDRGRVTSDYILWLDA